MKRARKVRRGRRRRGGRKRLRPAEIQQIRRALGKTQASFARMIGVSVATLRNWEQGRRQPEGAARALLRVAAYSPRVVAAALGTG